MVNENRSSQDRLSLICYQRTCDPLLSSFLWNTFLAMYGKLINFHMSMKVFALMWMRFLFDENENHLMYVIDIWLRFFKIIYLKPLNVCHVTISVQRKLWTWFLWLNIVESLEFIVAQLLWHSWVALLYEFKFSTKTNTETVIFLTKNKNLTSTKFHPHK